MTKYCVVDTETMHCVHCLIYLYKNKRAYAKLRARRAPEGGTILSAVGLGITWRPGDIFRTSQAKEVGLKKVKMT